MLQLLLQLSHFIYCHVDTLKMRIKIFLCSEKKIVIKLDRECR